MYVAQSRENDVDVFNQLLKIWIDVNSFLQFPDHSDTASS